MVQKQSEFSRSLYNMAKLGAYYTDTGHAKRIGQMFSFPSETCLLEPSVGNAAAVKSFLSTAEGGENVKLFGVELDNAAYEKSKKELDYSIRADFLSGIRISNSVFSACFANPPYGLCGDDGRDRLETKFVEKIYRHMIPGGFLILIVSLSTLQLDTFNRILLARFEPVSLYRFDEDEYEKYHQIVFIGTKRKEKGVLKSKLEEFTRGLLLSEIPFLPEESQYLGEPYQVPESLDSNVEIFTTTTFDPAICSEGLKKSNLNQIVRNKLLMQQHELFKLNQPPLPLKKDLLYLCAISGAGEGIAGSEEKKDIHLQRGTVKKVQVEECETNEESEKGIVRVRTENQISLNLIDNFGNIKKLI